MNPLIELKVPDIGGHQNVDVIEILIQPGQTIAKEDALITLETDKATMDVPAQQAGILRELCIKVGDKVSQGDVFARMEASDPPSAPPALPPSAVPPSSPQTTALRNTSTPQPAATTAPPPPQTHSTSSSAIAHQAFIQAHASPAVRRLARELGVDLSIVQGSERKGRIVAADVKTFVKTQLSSTPSTASTSAALGFELLPWPQVDFAKFGPIEHEPLSRIKKISGANLARNWVMIPHVTQFDCADITDMEAFRQTLNEENPAHGIKLTPLAFLMKACVAALKKYPHFNASLDQETLVIKRYYHIGFAADTPNGLVVPVIRDVDQKNLHQLAQEAAELAHKARDGKLGLNEMQGGTFSISSLGGIGGTAFTPIINAPEVAILGVSKSSLQAVFNGTAFVPRLMLPLSLSYDHRVIDGASAARFTQTLAQLLGDVRRLLL